MAVHILSTDEVRFELEVAGAGSRVLAYIIDSALKYGFIALVLMITTFFMPDLPAWAESLSRIGVLLVSTALFVIQWGYFLLFEWLMRGQTPGKRALGIRVVRDSGESIGLVESAVRNLVRYLDILGPGIVSMFLHSKCKRLGDMFAGTIVVYDRKLELDSYGPGRGAENPPASRVQLTSEEFELLTEFVNRREKMSPQARDKLGQRLFAMLKPRIPGLDAGGTANIETVIEHALQNALVERTPRR